MNKLNHITMILYLVICLNSCSNGKENISGKWVNLNAIESDDIYLFEFEGENLYSYSTKDLLKHQIEYRGEDQLLIGNNGKYNSYKIIFNTDDEITLQNDDEIIKLVSISSFTKNYLKKDYLLKYLWSFEIENNEDYNSEYLVNEFEFTRKNHVLHSYLSKDSVFSFDLIKYELLNIDSVSVLRLNKPVPQTIFIKDFSSKSISGLRAINGNELQHIILNIIKIEDLSHQKISVHLDGYWINSSSEGSINSIRIDEPLNMVIIDSDRSQYFEEKTFTFSKNMRFILLDDLLDRNEDIIELVSIEDNKITIKYGSDNVETLSRANSTN